MEHMTEFLIIGTNLLVVVASLIVAFVTMEDVVKDSNKTLREAIRALVRSNKQLRAEERK
jgi:hypothetical protein